MTKKHFLKKLDHALRKLKKAERHTYVSYYEELISDLIENGISEEDAIRRQGDINGIAQDIIKNMDSEKMIHIDNMGILLSILTTILLFASLYVWRIGTFAFPLISGDGPQSVFIAGKVGQPVALYMVTACSVVITIVYFTRRYKKGQ